MRPQPELLRIAKLIRVDHPHTPLHRRTTIPQYDRHPACAMLRMIKIGPHLAFLMKSLNEILRGMITLQKFYRYMLAKRAIITHGKMRAAPCRPHPIHAGCDTGPIIRALPSGCGAPADSVVPALQVGQQQIHCLSVKDFIPSTRFSQKPWPLRRWQQDRRIKNFSQLNKPVGFHRRRSQSCRCSRSIQPRARSRLLLSFPIATVESR